MEGSGRTVWDKYTELEEILQCVRKAGAKRSHVVRRKPGCSRRRFECGALGPS